MISCIQSKISIKATSKSLLLNLTDWKILLKIEFQKVEKVYNKLICQGCVESVDSWITGGIIK